MAFLGMRGDGDWVTNQRPESWREQILYHFPNGAAPLTAIMSMLGSEVTTDPAFHWWTKDLSEQNATFAAGQIFVDAALTTAYSSGGTVGQILYVKVGSNDAASEFRAGHTVQFRKEEDFLFWVRAIVVGITQNGADSYVTVKLLEAPNPTYDLDEVTSMAVIGNANEEGAEMPGSIAYNPVEYVNYTQIFRTPLSITNTARETRLRTGNGYDEAIRETLQYHAIEIEKAFLFGKARTETGPRGKPRRYTDGAITACIANNGVTSNYKTDTTYAGDTWLQSGELWLDGLLERVYRYGISDERLALCGSQALEGINTLAKAGGIINLEPMSASYGLQVIRWTTPFGTIFFKTHPLFTQNAALRNSMFVLEPERLRHRYISNRDTKFIEDPMDDQNRNNSRDGTEEEFLTEAGLEHHFAGDMGFFAGVGLDNTAIP